MLHTGRGQQRGRTKSQGSSDAGQIDECHVVFATLDAAHIRPVEVREVSKGFLRKFFGHACTSNCLAEGDEYWIFGERRRRFGHARDCPGIP